MSTRAPVSPAWTLTRTWPPGRQHAVYLIAFVTSSLVISAASAEVAGSGKNPATHDRASRTDSGRPAKARVHAEAGGLVPATVSFTVLIGSSLGIASERT